MKKGIVALIVLLAIVVIVSPGIIGSLAEKNLDANLNRAVDHSAELVVTSSGFERSWFSSQGEHRITLGEGSIRDMMTTLSGDSAEVPTLVISTALDHGLIPVSSMSGANASLAPGLGRGISTMRVELGGGEVIELPGKILSSVALNGDLNATYALEPGEKEVDGGSVAWQAATVAIEADASDRGYLFNGDIGGITMSEGGKVMTIGPMKFSGHQAPTQYGFFTGEFDVRMDSLVVSGGGSDSANMRGLSLKGTNVLDGSRAKGTGTFAMESLAIPGFGAVAFVMDGHSDADAAAIGRMLDALEAMSSDPDPTAMLQGLEEPAKDLAAAGFSLDFGQFDVTLPMGKVESKLALSAPESDRNAFEWTSLLMSGKANFDLRVPASLVEMATSMNPEAGAMIAMGFLRRDGDYYVMSAAMEKGLMSVNGAPIPIPLSMFGQ